MHTHQTVSNRDIVAVANKVLGTSYLRYQDLEAVMHGVKDRLHAQWIGSGCTDFSVYKDPQYVYEGINCFEKTRNCTGGAIAYFQRIKPGNVQGRRLIDTRTQPGFPYPGPPVEELTCIDVYSGVGLTTAHLIKNGFNVESFNDNAAQIEFMRVAVKMLAGKEVVNHTKLPRKKYDIAFSLEVLEHYPEPLEHVQDLIALIKPGGYLVESSGFNGSSENIGHFETYTIAGETVGFREARRAVSKAIEARFDKVYDGFNRMPKIWKLR